MNTIVPFFLATLLALPLAFHQAIALELDAPLSMAIASDDENLSSAVSDQSSASPQEASATTTDSIKTYKYVTDKLTITLRSGQSNKHKILRTLSSGARLGVLEESGEYARIRTDRGVEGWVLSRYLEDSPIAQQQLKQADERIQKLQKENQQQQQSIEKMQRTTQAVLATKNELSEKNEGLNIELTRIRTAAAQPLKLAEDIERISKDNTALKHENGLIKSELGKFRDSSEKQWFMMGAGTIVLGMAMGLVMPKLLRRRRKSDWESLS